MNITNTARTIANSKFVKNQATKIGNDVGGYAAKFAVGSVVLKDAVGCYFYVTQSLKNEKIPEDKRKFVASLDLANGILMIGTQLALAATIAKKSVQDKLQKALLKGFNAENLQGVYRSMKKQKIFSKLSPDDFEKAVTTASKTSKAGLKVVTSLIAATVVAKRMVVPFLATPMASWFKNKYLDDKNIKHPGANPFLATNPAMKGNLSSSSYSNIYEEFLNNRQNLKVRA